MFKVLYENRYLLGQMTKKDIGDRYKGSALGVVWAFVVPVLMLVIYTFVFSEVFQAKWGNATDEKFSFAMILFCGLSVFNMFSETISRATGLISANVNYVKKVVFPLEILPVTMTLTALFHASISYLILVVANYVLRGSLSAYLWLWPIAMLPAVVLTVGMGYLVSALSVFLKDLGNIINVIVMILMYTSPVFYSLSAVPEDLRGICLWNPMTYVVENLRNVVLYNTMLQWDQYLISCVYAVVALFVGYRVFSRTKEGFADVL